MGRRSCLWKSFPGRLEQSRRRVRGRSSGSDPPAEVPRLEGSTGTQRLRVPRKAPLIRHRVERPTGPV
jgi:hypothetical protein